MTTIPARILARLRDLIERLCAADADVVDVDWGDGE